MRHFTKVLCTALSGLLLSACAQPHPIPLGTDTTYYGFIDDGAKFGVSIGDSRDAARAAMARNGFGDPETTACGESGGLQDRFGCSLDEEFDIYHRHRGLGHSVVSLEIEDGRVRKIGWSSVLVH